MHVTATVYFLELSQNITMSDTPQVSLYWILAAKVLNGTGVVVTLLFGVEFAMAQTPNRMRGIVMGLVIIIIGWSTIYLLKYSTCSKHLKAAANYSVININNQ